MHLLKNANAYLKAQKEIDEVIGSGAIEADDLHKLKYLNAVLRETSRISPTVPALQKRTNPTTTHQILTVENGQYMLEPTDHIIILMGKAQQDPKVWGDTAEDFNPDRMLDENFDRINAEYPGCWKVSISPLMRDFS
jgi:cytochrome P450/NADPH-cytochrome P450 reductase